MSLRLLSALDEIAAIDRVHLTFVGSLQYVDSSAISTGVAVLLSAVTTSVRASVQTGDDPRGVTPANLAREGDPIGLTAAAGGFARPKTTVSRPWSQVRACATWWRSARTLFLFELADHHRMSVQARYDNRRPFWNRLRLQLDPLGLEMDAPESIARRELDRNPMNRRDLLAQRHVVTGQGVKLRRVQVAAEMDDQARAIVFRLPHHGGMDTHRRLHFHGWRLRGRPADRACQDETVVRIGVQIIGRIETRREVDDFTLAMRSRDHGRDLPSGRVVPCSRSQRADHARPDRERPRARRAP